MEWLIITLCLIAVTFWVFTRKKNPLKPGQPAPSFELADQYGKKHTLEEFKGKWLVLYFYPKDDTPGCTKQACTFRDDLQHILELGAEVIGVSVDNQLSHADFAKKYHLPFLILADETTEITQKYFSLINLGIIKFAQRNTFLIDPQGKIANIYLSVSAQRNAADIINELKQKQAIA